RYLANLQAFGIWRGNEPTSRPTARELFATALASASAESAGDLVPCDANCSPVLQDFASGGELIGPKSDSLQLAADSPILPQPEDGVLVEAESPAIDSGCESPAGRRIIRHQADQVGEECEDELANLSAIAARRVRRGRPAALDELAKGRLLGLL